LAERPIRACTGGWPKARNWTSVRGRQPPPCTNKDRCRRDGGSGPQCSGYHPSHGRRRLHCQTTVLVESYHRDRILARRLVHPMSTRSSRYADVRLAKRGRIGGVCGSRLAVVFGGLARRLLHGDLALGYESLFSEMRSGRVGCRRWIGWRTVDNLPRSTGPVARCQEGATSRCAQVTPRVAH
jgi:hypothetical protein